MKITLKPLREVQHNLEEIKKIQQKLGFNFPLTYRDFLLECGYSKVLTKNSINKQITESVEYFLGVSENEIKYNEHGLIFALTSSKNEIVLDSSGEILLIKKNKKRVKLANSFEEFLEGICVIKKTFFGFNI